MYLTIFLIIAWFIFFVYDFVKWCKEKNIDKRTLWFNLMIAHILICSLQIEKFFNLLG